MSGHSKWATTKRAKAVTDAKRSNLFTKLANTISVAAREGADAEMNFKLRIAVDRARSLSMPKDNIQRAIARGAGLDGENQLENITYEAYGPEGVGLIIETVTDNRNRTVSNLKHVLSKHGGTLGGAGSVIWQFELKGVITLAKCSLSEEQQLNLIDAGAEDFIFADDATQIISESHGLQKLKKLLVDLNLTIKDTGLEYRAKELIAPSNPQAITELLEILDDQEDVHNIFTNADV